MYLTQDLPLLTTMTYHKVRGDERKVQKLLKLHKVLQRYMQNYMKLDYFTKN